jgi:hypothetical protein
MSLSLGRGDRVHSQAATHRSLSPLAGLGKKEEGASEPRVETRGYYLPPLPGLRGAEEERKSALTPPLSGSTVFDPEARLD